MKFVPPSIPGARIAPLGILAAAFAVGIAVILTVVLIAHSQPPLGLVFSVSPERESVLVSFPDESTQRVTEISSSDTRIDLLPIDLTVEPDGAMGDYQTYRRFLARQDSLAEIQRAAEITISTASGRNLIVRASEKGRAYTSLPHEFWIQIAVGLISFLVCAGVFAFRSGDAAARYLLLSGAATLIFAPAAALYSTRELALPGLLFRWANDLNFLGGSLFAASFVALLLHYPRKIAPTWVGLCVVLVFIIWFAAQQIGFFESMTFARRFLVMIAVLLTFVLAAVHWIASKKDPVARASLKWFLLSWMLGSVLFAVCILLPQLFDIDTSHYQGYAFLLFILVYAGLALGILRYRLFELGSWWRQIFAWSGVVFLFVCFYLSLVTGMRLPPGLSLALALLFGVIIWIILRTWIWELVISPRDIRREELFASVLGVALGPIADQEILWKTFLTRLFDPLHLESIALVLESSTVFISGDGASLTVPGVGASGPLRLAYPGRGSRLFSKADSALASESRSMLVHALESRGAYEKGVAEERSRIALDIHDNVASQLLSALHLPDAAGKDQRIRETMAEIREMIRNSSSDTVSLEESLAELRVETAERLSAVGIALGWQCADIPADVIGSGLSHALRSVIREGVSNIIKHSGASRAEISLTLSAEILSLSVSDNGHGFEPKRFSSGRGLANFRERLHQFSSVISISSTDQGTEISAEILLAKAKSAV